MGVELGNAYDFSGIVGDAGLLWVCFAKSERNRHIWVLAPALEEPLSLQASVELESAGDQSIWLLPAVTIKIHEQNLKEFQPKCSYSIRER